jgi:hypothetical protein
LPGSAQAPSGEDEEAAFGHPKTGADGKEILKLCNVTSLEFIAGTGRNPEK